MYKSNYKIRVGHYACNPLAMCIEIDANGEKYYIGENAGYYLISNPPTFIQEDMILDNSVWLKDDEELRKLLVEEEVDRERLSNHLNKNRYYYLLSDVLEKLDPKGYEDYRETYMDFVEKLQVRTNLDMFCYDPSLEDEEEEEAFEEEWDKIMKELDATAKNQCIFVDKNGNKEIITLPSNDMEEDYER